MGWVGFMEDVSSRWIACGRSTDAFIGSHTGKTARKPKAKSSGIAPTSAQRFTLPESAAFGYSPAAKSRPKASDPVRPPKQPVPEKQHKKKPHRRIEPSKQDRLSPGSKTLSPLYRQLAEKCANVARLLESELRQQEWRKIAVEMDLLKDDWSGFHQRFVLASQSQVLDASKSILDRLNELSQSALHIVKTLGGHMPSIKVALEVVQRQRAGLNYPYRIKKWEETEEEALWILDGWLEMSRDLGQLDRRIVELATQVNAEAFDRVMKGATIPSKRKA